MNWFSNLLNLIKLRKVFVGVPVIIKNSKGEILLEKRSKKVFYPNQWGLPGGILMYKEKSEEAAKREVKEELGIKIKIMHKKSGSTYEFMPTKECPLHAINIVYYAKISSGKPKPLDETAEVKWFNPKSIKNMKLAYNHNNILKQEKEIK